MVKRMKYALRKSGESDFEFTFELNKTNMRRYVETLRGWDDDAERDDMRRHFQPGEDRIIVVDGRDAGRLVVERFPDRINLKVIGILPRYQGRGIGTAIIRDILDEAREAKIPATLMVLNINPAKRLYEKLGFATIEEADNRPKSVKYRMSTGILQSELVSS